MTVFLYAVVGLCVVVSLLAGAAGADLQWWVYVLNAFSVSVLTSWAIAGAWQR